MKAVVYEKRSTPDVLVLREVEKPVPNDDQVLVKVYAVSVNAFDYRSLQLGTIPRRKILGTDIAGRVEAAGKGITKFKIGDEVFGDLSNCGSGGFAEYVAAPEGALALKPDGVSFEAAAAVPMAAVTALQGLRDCGHIRQGQKVLIHGAGGGVGTFAVQLAKTFGVEVTALCSTQNTELVRSLGADHVIDYSKEDFAASDMQFDLILAVNGNRSLFSYKRVMSPNGIHVMIGGTYSQVAGSLLFGPLHSIGSKKMRFLAAKPNSKDLEFIIKLVKENKVRPVIDRRYPLEKTAEAVRYLRQGHARGKVVINTFQE